MHLDVHGSSDYKSAFIMIYKAEIGLKNYLIYLINKYDILNVKT